MKSLKILLVESNRTTDHMLFAKLLENPEYEISINVVNTIAEARKKIAHELFDAVVFHALEENESLELMDLKIDIPLVITKIQGEEHLYFQMLKSGIADFIDIQEKPLGSLPIIIEKAIQHKKNELNILRLAAIVDSSDDAIFSRSTQGIILSWNPGAEKLFGYTAAEAIGQSLSIITSPDQAQEVARIMQMVLNEETVHNLETKRKRKDGTFIQVSVSVAPMRDTLGKITGLSNIIRDISQQKAAEEKAKMMASIVESSDEGIISYSREGLVLSWNPGAEKIFGYAASEIIGKHISILTPDERKSEIANIIERVLTGEHMDHVETIRKKKNNELINVSLTISPIKDSFGKITAISGIARDITTRLKLEKDQATLLHQLENKNQELNHFVYLASHDLKAPLRAIGAIAYMLLEDYSDILDEAGKKNLNTLSGRVKRLDSLIDAIQHYSSIDTGVTDLQFINMNNFVQQIIHLINPPAKIKIEIDPLPEIVFSVRQLELVFTHLLCNAIEYNDKPVGYVKISCLEKEDYWLFSVADNGNGIDEKYFEKIFQIFQSLASRDQKESLGIGLSIVKKIIEINEGKIWLESTPGKGSTLYFTLSKKFALQTLKNKAHEMLHSD